MLLTQAVAAYDVLKIWKALYLYEKNSRSVVTAEKYEGVSMLRKIRVRKVFRVFAWQTRPREIPRDVYRQPSIRAGVADHLPVAGDEVGEVAAAVAGELNRDRPSLETSSHAPKSREPRPASARPRATSFVRFRVVRRKVRMATSSVSSFPFRAHKS